MRNIPTTSTGWGTRKINVALPGKVSLPRHQAWRRAHLPGDAVDLRLPCVTWNTHEESLLAGEEASRGVPEVIPGLGQLPAVCRSRSSSTGNASSAGSMSGGEQQMLAVSRCLLSDPKVVLLDEVSMGLAPRVIDQIYEALLKLARTGTSLLLVEQYVTRALRAADHVYVLARGSVTFTGRPSELNEAELMRRYVGS
jgi:ABC-type transport system involved in cytochrome bd biosynthesis fused ATPase/permease subunit